MTQDLPFYFTWCPLAVRVCFRVNLEMNELDTNAAKLVCVKVLIQDFSCDKISNKNLYSSLKLYIKIFTSFFQCFYLIMIDYWNKKIYLSLWILWYYQPDLVSRQTVQIKYSFKLSKYAMQLCTIGIVSSLSNLK